jgi:chromate transport protein ChrA
MNNIVSEFSKNNPNIKIIILGLLFCIIVMMPNYYKLINKLTDNIIYRSIIIILIIYMSNHDIQITIMLVIIFLMSLNKNNVENFGNRGDGDPCDKGHNEQCKHNKCRCRGTKTTDGECDGIYACSK